MIVSYSIRQSMLLLCDAQNVREHGQPCSATSGSIFGISNMRQGEACLGWAGRSLCAAVGWSVRYAFNVQYMYKYGDIFFMSTSFIGSIIANTVSPLRSGTNDPVQV